MKPFHATVIISLLLALFAVPGAAAPFSEQGGDQPEVRIGVLAKRGVERAHARWGTTADYLSEKVPGHHFAIIPLGFGETYSAVKERRIDFVLANSAIYVDLEVRFGASRLATLVNRNSTRGHTVYAGVIFCRSDRSDLRSLSDLRGKSFMAVNPTSFGGFLMARRELEDQQISPYQDFSRLEMSGTHDGVVHAVLRGEVDAGTVRSDTLERMASEQKIDLAKVRILNPQSHPDFPHLHSTRLYPEWPIASLPHVPDPLARDVAVALLQMPADSPAARFSMSHGWTIPHEYQPVHECLKALQIAPYHEYGVISPGQAARQFWAWLLGALLLLGLGFFASFYLLRLNRRIRESSLALEEARRGLEEKVALRTRDLHQTNIHLKKEIEERRRSEEALREERARLELITGNLGVGVAMISRDFKVIMANEVIRDIFGPVEGKTCFQVFNRKDAVCYGCGVQRIFATGVEHSEHEQSGLDAQGNEIWSQIFATPIRDANGNITAAIEVVVPITDRKRAEQALVLALGEAEETRDRIDNIIKSVADGLIVTDTRHRVLSLNQAAENLLGTTLEDSLLFPVRQLFAKLSTDTDFDGILDGGQKGSWEFEMPPQNGERGRILQARASAMRNKNGDQTGTVIILQDVTRERELNRMKDSFISTAAHELRTPLTSIMGYSELLLHPEDYGEAVVENQADFVGEIYDKSLALTRIVDDLLDISRIESGAPIPLKKGEHQLKTILEKVVQQYRKFSHRHRFDLSIDGDGQTTAAIDPDRLVQVLENLLSNAVKYSPEGGLIRVGCRRNGDAYTISVADQGIGMTEEQVERIFDKFYRADHSNTAVSGLGLGMSIARQIVESHEGRIWVESRPKQGTTICFSLPALP